MEEIFNREEILEIENDANRSDFRKGITICNGNSNSKTIIHVSKQKELIFVNGNLHTGFEHINARHSIFSLMNFWKSTNDLDNPSKIIPEASNILGYIKISESIFKEENKNTIKNYRPEIFDMYTGSHTHNDVSEVYHLLLYKNSLIVHTLFPQSKKQNRKFVLKKYVKGIIKSKFKFPEGVEEMIIPYENSDGIVSYSILFRKEMNNRTESVFFQMHNEFGVPIETILIAKTNFEVFERYDDNVFEFYQYSDLFEIEKMIEQFDLSYNSE
jgi:hypothetical protein